MAVTSLRCHYNLRYILPYSPKQIYASKNGPRKLKFSQSKTGLSNPIYTSLSQGNTFCELNNSMNGGVWGIYNSNIIISSSPAKRTLPLPPVAMLCQDVLLGLTFTRTLRKRLADTGVLFHTETLTTNRFITLAEKAFIYHHGIFTRILHILEV